MSKKVRKTFSLAEASEITGIDCSTVVIFIQREWICPTTENVIDEEDIARIYLIEDLRHNFGANDEAIPVILHLMDQLYYLRQQILKTS